MNLFQKIKTLFVVKDIAQDTLKEAQKMNGSTPGWKTTEFWSHVASQATVLWAAIQGFIPPKYAAIISVSGAAVYTICRTVYKVYTDVNGLRTGASGSGETATATATVKAA